MRMSDAPQGKVEDEHAIDLTTTHLPHNCLPTASIHGAGVAFFISARIAPIDCVLPLDIWRTNDSVKLGFADSTIFFGIRVAMPVPFILDFA